MNAESTGTRHQGAWVASELFARYAEMDLDRWRQLVGRHVQHRDDRWGRGTVDAVIWGAPVERIPEYVQVRISYEAGWTVEFHSQTWHLHHQRAFVAESIERVIRRCLDPALSQDEQSECLIQHSRELREAFDREVLTQRLARQQHPSPSG